MTKLSVVWVIVTLLVTAASVAAQTAETPLPAGTNCTEPRIRKPWEQYSPDERTRYVKAIQLAITRGFHQKFVELHVEFYSEREAHQTCMFIYWHRMFLLGYENMLRSLGTGYECVTIPYWDHLSATARLASTNCTTIEGCSPIYQGLGGSGSGLQKSIRVYNITIPRSTGSWCVNKAPLSAFCGNTTTCATCVVRGTAYSRSYPSEAFFGSVYQQVFDFNDWANFATSVERGVHNTVHSHVGGSMMFMQSPIDPIFYTHHSFVDLLQTIYLKCQLDNETQTIPLEQKGNDSRFFANCARRTGGFFNGSDTITMLTRSFNFTEWVPVRTNPRNTLYAFFKDLPGTFAEYVDAKDLGVYSYSYMYQGALTNMYTNCAKSDTIASATVALMDDEQEGHTKGGVPRPIRKPPTPTDDQMRRWTIAIYESARLSGYTVEAANDQMETILCIHKKECFGGVEDYDPVFRKNFGVVGHPRCFTIVREVEAGDRVIGIPKWRAITDKFFPCKKRKTSKKTKAITMEAEALEA